MRTALLSAFAFGPLPKFTVGKEPFGLRYRSPPVLSPFGLSLSKPLARGTKASTSSAWPFDKLRANGNGEPTFVNSRSGPKAETRFTHLRSRAAPWNR
jgi:hypothetical protein